MAVALNVKYAVMHCRNLSLLQKFLCISTFSQCKHEALYQKPASLSSCKCFNSHCFSGSGRKSIHQFSLKIHGPGQVYTTQSNSCHDFISPAFRNSYTTVSYRGLRNFSTTLTLKDIERKHSSQVEATVQDLKEKTKDPTQLVPKVDRKSLYVRIKDEILHYYHGFRLLFIDVRLCSKYVWRILNGDQLSRRENRQLIRTTGDLFRLLPFSVFIIVPFMEFLLPVALKLFPGMLPSTFETANEKEAKMKKRLKVKLEYAKFLQKTLDSLAVQGKGHHSERAREFLEFFTKIQKTGESVTSEDVMKFSKLFEDEITLDSLTRPQLIALCKLLEMPSIGTNNFLRFQLQMKLRALSADDKIIQHEGIESLAVWELQQACRARGMRAYGMSEERMRHQLRQWLDLSLNESVPPSLLLLSRTLYLPENIPALDTIAATISTLPEEVATHATHQISTSEGKIDNLTRLEIIKSEEKRIKQDKEELEKELEEKRKKEIIAKKKTAEEGVPEEVEVPLVTGKILPEDLVIEKATISRTGEIQADTELIVDKAPFIEDKAPVISGETEVLSEEITQAEVKGTPEELTAEDLKEVEEAIETIAMEKHRLLIEEQDLSELKEELADYEEDLQDFSEALVSAGIDEKSMHESKAARRLYVKLNKMISRMDPVVKAIRKETKSLYEMMPLESTGKERAELLTLEELAKHLKEITSAPDSSKVEVIKSVLSKLDTNQDGSVKVDHVLKALEQLSAVQGGVSAKLFDEVIEVMAKEEQLETQALIQRTLKSSTLRNIQTLRDGSKGAIEESEAESPAKVKEEKQNEGR